MYTWVVCMWMTHDSIVCMFVIRFFKSTWKLYDFACAALVLFWSRLHRRTHTSEWERSVWSKVSLNFTSRQFDLNHWLPALQTEHMLSDPLHCLWLTDYTVCALSRWEMRDVCMCGSCLPVLILLLGIKSYSISRMELTFTCMCLLCYYFIMFFGLFYLS